MAQTLSSLASSAKDKLKDSFEQDPKSDKNAMVDQILKDLSPSEVSEILQLASLNPELLSEEVIAAITKNVHEVIKVSLQEELVEIQADLEIKQQEILNKQAELDAEKAALEDKASSVGELGEAIENIAKP